MNEPRPRVHELIEPVVRVEPDLPLATAALLLNGTEIDTLWVDGTPPCELTVVDIVDAVARGLPTDAVVGDAARNALLSIGPDTLVEDAVTTMVRAGRRSLIVVDRNGRALGLVRLAAALTALLQGPPWLGALRIALRIDEVAW
jgi:predicted transcriptional regulator